MEFSEIHFSYTVQQLYKLFITLCNRRTKFVTIHVVIIKQSGKITLCFTAFCRFLDVAKHTLQCFI